MSPEVWELVARELNTIGQLSRNWLPPEQAEKIARHLALVRRLVRGKGDAPPVKRATPKPSRRRSLWRRDPRCFWCGRETDITMHDADDSATIEHVYPRGHLKRRSTRRHLPDVVLA
jgi:hypothetical protein